MNDTKLAYMDASAFVKLVAPEPETAALAAALRPDVRLVSCEILHVEVLRAVRRAVGQQGATAARSQLEGVRLLPVSEQILKRASGLEPVTLRTLDAIHIAAALDLGERLEALYTYDVRMAAAATQVGIRVCAPSGQPIRAVDARNRLTRAMFNRIDHIGVAVEDVEAALPLYRDHFQMQVAHREIVEDQGVEAVLLDVGENHVELLAPLGEDTPVGKFLAKKGLGLHHVAYQVSDIDATLSSLKQAGVPLIDEQPRVGIRGSLVAFLHPKGTGGVLTEIVQPVEVH